MPELFVALQRNESRSSKSFGSPPFQIMKVLPLAGFVSVVSPWIPPSFTLHSRGSPSQPVKSLPLNSGCIPLGSGGASLGESIAKAAQAKAKRATAATLRRTTMGGLRSQRDNKFDVNIAIENRSE